MTEKKKAWSENVWCFVWACCAVVALSVATEYVYAAYRCDSGCVGVYRVGSAPCDGSVWSIRYRKCLNAGAKTNCDKTPGTEMECSACVCGASGVTTRGPRGKKIRKPEELAPCFCSHPLY